MPSQTQGGNLSKLHHKVKAEEPFHHTLLCYTANTENGEKASCWIMSVISPGVKDFKASVTQHSDQDGFPWASVSHRAL